ncbi:MAG: exo-alpha-sialidase [Spirochaetaceae bacterium]|nr:exo-alpha-sialidase [Spirochaetaceae bacterium]
MVRMKSRRKAAARFVHAAAAAAIIAIAGLGFAGLLPSCDELPLKLEAKRLVEEAAGGGGGIVWSIETVINSGDVGQSASISLFGNNPRIVGWDVGSRQVKFVKSNAGVWSSPESAKYSNQGKCVLKMLASTDTPMLAVSDGASDEFYLVSNNGSGWTNVFQGTRSSMVSIGLAMNGDLTWPAFIRSGAVREAWYVLSGTETLIDDVNIGVCIAIEYADERPHVVYGSGTDIVYRRWVGSWSRSVVTTGPGQFMQDCDFAVLGAGTIIELCYVDGNLAKLVYSVSTNGGTTWTETTVAANNCGSCSLGLGPAGVPCIAYFETLNRNLMFAYKTTDGVWKTETVDAEGDVGYDASIAVDGNARIHIAYYDTTNGDLKYATRSTPW